MAVLCSITDKDWLINQKSLPDPESNYYEEFYDYHKRLCIEGCMLQGVYIPGYLYWHLNLWKTEVDFLDQYGRPQQKYDAPLLRDNEWLFFNGVYEAEKAQRGLVVGGSRRLGKSVMTSSYIGHGATFDEHSQNVIAAASEQDLNVTTAKIDKGLVNIPDYYRWPRIEDNWKRQVTFGMKASDGRRFVYSTIYIRNLSGGNNEEVLAGLKPRKLLIEEAGKSEFIKALQAAIPGFTTPFGWTCSPIVIFTGGDINHYHDAKELFFNTDAYNFLEFENEKEPGRVHGLFLGNKYRQDAKKESTLGEFLNLPKNHCGHRMKMLVADEEKAVQIASHDLEKRKKAGDSFAFLKEKMYFPATVDDMFLNSKVNIFSDVADAVQAQLNRLVAQNITGSYVELYHDGEVIKHRPSNKTPVLDFPIPRGSIHDCPVIMWEPPIDKPPFGLYIASVDSYKDGTASYSDSLGVVYIFKRMHSISSEKFQNMIVACYAARPENKEDWNRTAEYLIKYYNAKALVENDEISFIEYMSLSGNGMYLAETPAFARELVPHSATLSRPYGISRQSRTIREWLLSALKAYLKEKLYVEKDENDNVIKEVLGVSRIRHQLLLKQILAYDDDNNFDCVVAASILFGYAAKLDPIIGGVSDTLDPRYQSLKKGIKPHTKLFTDSTGLFLHGKNHKLF